MEFYLREGFSSARARAEEKHGEEGDHEFGVHIFSVGNLETVVAEQ
jgi:hypothetical protein